MRSVHSAGAGGGANLAASGTFSSASGTIELQLREDEGRSSYVWVVRGDWKGDRFTLSYPDPADGWITETYRRSGL